MLTVALFSHSRYLCGAERMLLNLALLLERTGTVRPVLLVPGEGELACEAHRHGLACQMVPQPSWHLARPGDILDYCRGAIACSDALKQVLVDINSDAVLINTTTNVPPMLAAVALGIPSLLWVHGVIDSLLLPGRASEFATRHDELLLASATRVIALSNYTSDFCARMMGRTRLDVIHNWTPVDPQFVPPPDKYRSRRFACLNTFDRHKGYATLLKAAALLKARKILFELHLYGDGEVRGEMETRAAGLGVQDCVHFEGRTTRVQEVYDSSLGIVNPAQVEPFGMTLIEAMARKTPVVATRSGGPADIVVDGQTGYLVERGDAAAIADRMQALLESPELAQRLGEEGFQRVCTHFHEDPARAAFLPVIEEAVRDFQGYDPAVKTLTKIYRLWLDQTAGGAAGAGSASPSAASPVQKAARLAKGGIRRTKVLGRRVLTVLGIADPPRPAASDALLFENALAGPIGAKTAVDPSGTPQTFLPVRRKVRYRLVPNEGNWAGLDVLVSRDPLQAAGRLRLCVRTTSGRLLREATSSLGDMGEKGWLGFRFAPIANAGGTPFDVEFVAEKSSPTGTIAICKSETPETARPRTATRKRVPRFGLPWQRKALYCKTWHA
jgi:glycosyltransferase involved in cell wall biosynthesis